MSDGFTIGAAMGEPSIFECPNCKETIDAKAENCRFCGVKVDREAARSAAALLARINQACSDASYMRSTALALPVFFGLRFVPIISMLGSIGFLGLSLGIPIWSARWWWKFAKIDAHDAEFRKARKTVMWVGIIVSLVAVLFEIVPFVLAMRSISR